MRKQQPVKAWAQEWRDYLLITLGAVITSAAYGLFLVPNHIAPGGVSGIAMILNYRLQWPVGIVIIVLNIPLFFAAARMLGLRFAIKALFGTAVLSILIDVIPYPCLTQEGFLACVFGGAMMGAGLGLVFRANGSTGGSDLAAQMLHKKHPGINIGWILFAIDTVVVVSAAVFIDKERALFGLATLYLSAKTIELITMGQISKAFWIITKKAEVISQYIIHDLGRSVTSMAAKGHYSGEMRDMLLVVVQGRDEVLKIKKMVKETDPEACMIINDAREVLGKGFGGL